MAVTNPVHWARSLLEREKFYILDTETTGLGSDDEVIQIGVLDGAGGVVLETLVRPSKPIPSGATNVHGITDADVAEQPIFASIYVQISSLLAGEVVVAYNADFDQRLLDQTCMRYGLPKLRPLRWDCAMKQYATFYGQRRSNGGYRWQNLSNACRQQGVEVANAHSAVGDCVMTLELIKRMAGGGG